MKFLRWLVSWILYTLGHCTYFIMNYWNTVQIYSIYSKLMLWSLGIQGEYLGKYWVWKKPESKEDE